MKLIILDRDGVINYESRDFIKSPDEWHELDGSIEAIADLSKAGYTIVVATNQSGVGRKLFDTDMLQKIHAKMLLKIALYTTSKFANLHRTVPQLKIFTGVLLWTT